MYIHRIVIDANRINTRGRISAMNSLEALHDAGLVELFQTTTLPVEFRNWSPGRQKARNYTVIGGSAYVNITGGNVADARPGASGRKTRFIEIHRVVFGEPASVKKKRDNDMRDALHIDQANQHDVDFFITDENAILSAASDLAAIGVTTLVCSAEDCISHVSRYFSKFYGTSDPSTLIERLNQEGPIFLGSNSCGGTAFADVESGEILLAFESTDNGVGVNSIIRGNDGELLLAIEPGQPLRFPRPGAQVCMEIGPARVLLGDKQCRSFAITAGGQPALSGRVLRNGHVLFYNVSLRNKSGRVVFQVVRDTLECSGGTVSAYSAP